MDGGKRGGGKTWSWKMIDRRRHCRYRGASTCIAAIVKSIWTMWRRWPLSGSTKPEILDVLDVAIRTATRRRLISADKWKKKSLCHDSLLWHRDSLDRILRRGRPTFGHLYQNCSSSFFFPSTNTEGFLSKKPHLGIFLMGLSVSFDIIKSNIFEIRKSYCCYIKLYYGPLKLMLNKPAQKPRWLVVRNKKNREY